MILLFILLSHKGFKNIEVHDTSRKILKIDANICDHDFIYMSVCVCVCVCARACVCVIVVSMKPNVYFFSKWKTKKTGKVNT